MPLSYKRLFKLLIDKNMKKNELCKKAAISSASLTKLGKGQNVNSEIIAKICDALSCNIDDIVEVIHENKSEDVNNESKPN